MKITKVCAEDDIKTMHEVKANKLYETQNASAIHLTLQPGQSLIKHITPVDVYFYVLEGTGIVEIGNEKHEVSTDMLIDSPKDIPHCWHNNSKKPLRILVNKVPKPTKKTKIL